MPEGDTIHRIALRINAALAGRRLDSVAAPNRRSPLHARTGELDGATLEDAEARGKHLLLRFADGLVVHSHLGMNGRWFVRTDGSEPFGRPWLTLVAGTGVASQIGGQAAATDQRPPRPQRSRTCGLGPDPLGPGFDRPRRAVG